MEEWVDVLDVLDLDCCDGLDEQRAGEISNCRQRSAESRATGVPSARGGKYVGLSASLPEPERSGSPANGMTRRREWYRRLISM
jgi:hypothetical protein